MMGDWLITVTEDTYFWIKQRNSKVWARLLLMLFHIVNFLVFQLVNLFAQLRWPFSALCALPTHFGLFLQATLYPQTKLTCKN